MLKYSPAVMKPGNQQKPQEQALISITRKLAPKFSRNSQASQHLLSVNLQTLWKASGLAKRFAKGTRRTQVTV